VWRSLLVRFFGSRDVPSASLVSVMGVALSCRRGGAGISWREIISIYERAFLTLAL
jgi:hypothetical protein